ncbi:FMN-binding glutamate synthase family protein [Flavobacterium gawalongense]|uniref:FMN-binding glutamate synthase family protein n=1 Tax=Flavobacterium gawalongense TaxID=2594432 RepID=A0A553BH89_9FLAO|nr:FMN-binding glutamate synthase family protein [Flavobacterium gawalongense]TRX03363.1 FMN-binding glutamate synthase family protein [Flavobacterium gawalongense]TRX06870.1 FMN-binding glutamate synthase family protein [Flavobacterium gawalongense]TRX07634.1 FMN-binding glutamate synthase family protein [Flavobacterium gawalongense]TRX11434.1 FMN-binding glutamate synthase family protein [Flavobacterium gawalongense]TRX29203.1 FMN-binding glutamate synthase family protein [Flavobacterium gaw
MRQKFFVLGITAFIITSVLYFYFNIGLFLLVILSILLLVGLANSMQHKHAILRNFPVFGYFRYLFEMIAPEIQQYFIERSTDGKPFSRNQRTLAYQRAKNIDSTSPFGTQLNLNRSSYEGIKHSIFPATVNEELPRVLVGGPDCTQPYSASLLNISAMSFGSLSENAIMALNKGALKGKFYHNTGEGGLTEFHQQGGDITWQIGTGYFGCRDDRGSFDGGRFAEKANLPEVKMIEIKLSQGAKPGHGGVLPAAKNTEQIAKIRGVQPHTTILSPPSHSAFSDAKGLVEFIAKLRLLSNGKPIGFKLCIGETSEFELICQEIMVQNCFPDFITVDGAEGGTGAAPLEFADGVGMPLEPALIFVNKTLVRFGIRDKIRIICSGKIISGYSILKAVALGADMCNCARGFMFSLGCIQALRCNTNECPTGVATQNKMLMKGLVVTDKSERVFYFHKNTLHAANELLAAAGKKSFTDVDINIFMRGDEFTHLSDLYFPDNLKSVTKH